MSKVPHSKQYNDAYDVFKKSFNSFIDKIVNKINTLTTKTITFSETRYEVTLQDNTVYKYIGLSGVSELIIKYPKTDFVSTIIFPTKADGDIKIIFPNGTLIAGHIKLEFFNCEYWELNIHNGIVTAVQLFEK